MRSVVCLLFAACPAVAADPGFEPLFNGKDLTGWQSAADGKDRENAKGEPVAGKTETPMGRFAVTDGTIVVGKGKGPGVLKTEMVFAGDVTVRFEFKPGKGCNNDLYFRGVKFDIKDQSLKLNPIDVMKPMKLDEWNVLEVEVKGAEFVVKCNGEAVQTLKAKGDATPFALRAEGGPIAYRNVQAKGGK